MLVRRLAFTFSALALFTTLGVQAVAHDRHGADVRSIISEDYVLMQQAQEHNDPQTFFSYFAPGAMIDFGFANFTREQLLNFWQHPSGSAHFSDYRVTYHILSLEPVGANYIAHVKTAHLPGATIPESTDPAGTMLAGLEDSQSSTTWKNVDGAWRITALKLEAESSGTN